MCNTKGVAPHGLRKRVINDTMEPSQGTQVVRRMAVKWFTSNVKKRAPC